MSLLSLAISAFNPFKGKGKANWAVLVAGSNAYWNYRHQSDIFHAYQILRKNGIPEENIIVLAFDDIAYHAYNVLPGNVFNKPDKDGKGFNVYEGVKIDYRGDDVTPSVFLSVLKGDSDAVKGKGTGRVLQSTKNDNVFIYFSDHGATGLIAFPSEELYANDLIETLKYMHENKKYKELVFYLEACESGSMFEKLLPNDLNIYTTTAANAEESSWATYCQDAVVDGKDIGSCLGDEYSVNWMEDTESNGVSQTLNEQYEKVKAKTKGSHVQQFGDLVLSKKSIGEFVGNKDGLLEKIKDLFGKISRRIFGEKSISSDRIDSREVKLRYLYSKAAKTNSRADMDAFNNELNFVKKVDSIFNTFDQIFGIYRHAEIENINFDCLKASVREFKKSCNWGEYNLKYVRNIAHACQKYTAEEISKAFERICILS